MKQKSFSCENAQFASGTLTAALIGFFRMPGAGCEIHGNYTRYAEGARIGISVTPGLTRYMLMDWLHTSAFWSETDVRSQIIARAGPHAASASPLA